MMDSSVSNVKLREADRLENERLVADYEKKNGPIVCSPIDIKDNDAMDLIQLKQYETAAQKKAKKRGRAIRINND